MPVNVHLEAPRRVDLKQFIQRPSDGALWCSGHGNGPDSWTFNPHNATDVGGYVYLKDAIGPQMQKAGYILVEYEVLMFPTGKKTDDLYKDGMCMSEWHHSQCEKGLHSWAGETNNDLDPELKCLYCGEEYGYPD